MSTIAPRLFRLGRLIGRPRGSPLHAVLQRRLAKPFPKSPDVVILPGESVFPRDLLNRKPREQQIGTALLRYASAYARDKASISGWGIAKIKYMLSAKGIARETVSMALAEIDSDKAESRLEKLIENKYRSLKDDPQCRMKLLRFALGRGYSYDDAIPLIDRYVRGY